MSELQLDSREGLLTTIHEEALAWNALYDMRQRFREEQTALNTRIEEATKVHHDTEGKIVQEFRTAVENGAIAPEELVSEVEKLVNTIGAEPVVERFAKDKALYDNLVPGAFVYTDGVVEQVAESREEGGAVVVPYLQQTPPRTSLPFGSLGLEFAVTFQDKASGLIGYQFIHSANSVAGDAEAIKSLVYDKSEIQTLSNEETERLSKRITLSSQLRTLGFEDEASQVEEQAAADAAWILSRGRQLPTAAYQLIRERRPERFQQFYDARALAICDDPLGWNPSADIRFFVEMARIERPDYDTMSSLEQSQLLAAIISAFVGRAAELSENKQEDN